jgi:uncharacterized protein (TIGR00375 family)
VRFVVDFHIHSHYSRATTPQLTPENLDYWSRLKGIHVMGTGDGVHPGWLAELREKLEPVGNGLYRLKPSLRRPELRASLLAEAPLQFLLTTEISSIYKKGGRVRKVHTIVVLPDLDAAQRLAARLEAIGNIKSDGRPILGLDAKRLLEIVLEVSPAAYLIPAHIWTPWFSLLGSMSGFDSLRECFDDLAGEIFAVETGLSSDPAMNRVCSFLDSVRLVSNSDAHSPEKLGREANIFDTELSYAGIRDALKHDRGFVGTIEFFPQEGKYHYDGHRNCEVRWNPLETLTHRGVCSGCEKPVTRGVMYRVAQLADRPEPAFGNQRYWSITPLPELLAELLGVAGAASQKVRREHLRLIQQIGPEFDILLWAELDRIAAAGGERLAEGIRRLRAGEVSAEEGYDGEFGRIRVFRDRSDGALFTGDAPAAARVHSIEFDIADFQRRLREQAAPEPSTAEAAPGRAQEQQEEAIRFGEGVCLVLAGPGSGKTYTLTERIAWLIGTRGVPPSEILALTFSNKAAEEIRRRLAARLGDPLPTVSTFHALGVAILHEHAAAAGLPADFTILDDDQRHEAAEQAAGDRRGAGTMLRAIEAHKQGRSSEPPDGLAAYERALAERGAVDLDDLIHRPARLLAEHPSLAEAYQRRWRWLLVDEVQDLNAEQYRLLRLLGGARPNLLAIGDPDQAIYGFRGSDARLVQRLQADHPGARVIILGRSFRCPSVILQGAGQVLQKRRILDGLEAEVKIQIQSCTSDRSEAEWIAGCIERMIGGTHSLSLHRGASDGTAEAGIASFRDFAILCRTSLLFAPIAEALAAHGIAHQIVGSEPFYRQEPWASAIRRLRTALHTPAREPEAAAWIAQAIPLAEVLPRLLDSEPSDVDRDRMARLAERFGARYAEFVRALALRQGVDDHDAAAERVSLMTIHASKGLEFPAVFVPGCEQGLIPWEQFGALTDDQRAEEERLFYVAMTRTKRWLFLSHAAKRILRGKPLPGTRCALLDRVERDLLDLQRQRLPARPKDEFAQLSMFG